MAACQSPRRSAIEPCRKVEVVDVPFAGLYAFEQELGVVQFTLRNAPPALISIRASADNSADACCLLRQYFLRHLRVLRTAVAASTRTQHHSELDELHVPDPCVASSSANGGEGPQRKTKEKASGPFPNQTP